VAFVDPPPRPGATLWSLAAGPLVNALLAPILFVCFFLTRTLQFRAAMPNLSEFVLSLWIINIGLLIFNLLPIYPLDGGQILRSLLWFICGRARSLMIASVIGLVAIAFLLLYAIRTPWLGIMAAFAVIQCWSGLQQARLLARVEAAPRRSGLACPACHVAPPTGDFWICGRCRRPFDMFASQGFCPHCGVVFNGARCLDCGQVNPLRSFFQS